MSPEEQRVLKAAESLTLHGEFTYGSGRGDETPKPTCAGCGSSSWGEIEHYQDCRVIELIAAVQALSVRRDTGVPQ